MAIRDVIIGYVKGPQGATGKTGDTGKDSPMGPAGPQGPLVPLVNNGLATQAGVGDLDAVMGKTLTDKYNQINSDLTDLSGAFGQHINKAVTGDNAFKIKFLSGNIVFTNQQENYGIKSIAELTSIQYVFPFIKDMYFIPIATIDGTTIKIQARCVTGPISRTMFYDLIVIGK